MAKKIIPCCSSLKNNAPITNLPEVLSIKDIPSDLPEDRWILIKDINTPEGQAELNKHVDAGDKDFIPVKISLHPIYRTHCMICNTKKPLISNRVCAECLVGTDYEVE